jgi:hypothetical protein
MALETGKNIANSVDPCARLGNSCIVKGLALENGSLTLIMQANKAGRSPGVNPVKEMALASVAALI